MAELQSQTLNNVMLTTYVANAEQVARFVNDSVEELSGSMPDMNKLGISYVSTEDEKKIRLSYDGDEIGGIDASEFVKDGMVSSVSYDEESHVLTIKWNADAGRPDEKIGLSGLADAQYVDDSCEALSSGLTGWVDGQGYLTEHQQLRPVYGGNGQKFGAWSLTIDGEPDTSSYEVLWNGESGYVVWRNYGTEDEANVSSPKGDLDSTTITWTESVDAAYNITATRTENPIIGYTLGDQTDKRLASVNALVTLSSGLTGWVDGRGYLVPEDVKISYDGEERRIVLSSGDAVTSIGCDDFIKDGMISDVYYDEGSHMLSITSKRYSSS